MVRDIIFHADSGALEKLYEREQDYETHTATYKVEDTNHGNVYMYLTRGADLPSDSVKTYACYVDINGRDNSDGSVPANNKGWESRYTVLTNLWKKNSMTERSFDIEARYYVGEQTQIQSFEINLERIPTLADLQVFGSGTRLPMEFAPLTGEYSLTTVAESVVISPFPVLSDYRILVNGNDTQREVVLNGIGESTAVDVTVEYTVNAEENITRTFSYTLNITRLQATDVNVIIPAGTEAEIVNAAGGVIQPLVCGEVVDGVYVNTYALTRVKNMTVSQQRTGISILPQDSRRRKALILPFPNPKARTSSQPSAHTLRVTSVMQIPVFIPSTGILFPPNTNTCSPFRMQTPPSL